MSTLTEEGVSHVKQVACDKLLAQRIEAKMKGKKVNDVLNRLHLATPAPRDNRERPPTIPSSVLKAREAKANGQMDEGEEQVITFGYDSNTPQAEEEPFWLRGFNSMEWRKRYKLKDDEWRFDVVPEIMEGMNIADYVDPDILARLEELEREEEEREKLHADEMAEDDEDLVDLTDEQIDMIGQIRAKKSMKRYEHTKLVRASRAQLPKHAAEDPKLAEFEANLGSLGIDTSKAADRLRARSRSKSVERSRKRTRSLTGADDDEEEAQVAKLQRSRTRSLTPNGGFKDVKQKFKANVIMRNAQKSRNLDARKGEGDRVVLNMRPKHLFTGKRTIGKTQRR